MSHEIFIINNIYGNQRFFFNLDKAKEELINIYNVTPNYKYYNYKIDVYTLNDNEYIITNTSYTYIFNIFFTHNHKY